MRRGAKIAIGSTAAAFGVGAAGYVWWSYRQRATLAALTSGLSLTAAPAAVSASAGATAVSVTAAWRNTSKVAATYGLQGVVVDESGAANLVAGHLFVSASVAQTVESALTSGQAVSAAQYVGDPHSRVQLASVGAGASGMATLYGFVAPRDLVPPVQFVVWLVPNPSAGSLLVDDTLTGSPLPGIPGRFGVPIGVATAAQEQVGA